MQNKIKEFIKKYWLLFIIVTQPILDIIAYFSFSEKVTLISFTIRSIYLLFIVLYCFFTTKEKKKMFYSFLPFIIFSFLHLLNSYRLYGTNIIDDIRYLVCVMQMPAITISLCFYLKENINQIKNITKGLIISALIIFASIVISILTNSYNTTYMEYGITGWFSSPNTQSMVLTCMTPICLYLLFNKKKISYFLGIIIFFLLLFFNGTRACYYTLVSTLFIMTIINIIDLTKSKENPKKIIFTLLSLILAISLYNGSITSLRSDDVAENDEQNEINIGEIDSNISREELIKIMKTNYIYETLINDFGEDRVYNEVKNDITTSKLSDNRYVKRIYGKFIFEDSDTLTKIVGYNHGIIGKYGKDLENDITAIFYYYGYLGFAIYFGFIIYFFILALKVLIKDPTIIFSSEYIILSFGLALAIFGSQFSGALLRKPQANIYLALLLSLYFMYNNTKINSIPKLNKNKVSFLLLHLGYGGIETSTINTANALCNKYEIEFISFYNLNNNQVGKIDDRIKVKYLYEGGPNRDEFKKYLHEHKYFNVLKEGIKAVDILIKKKVLVIQSIIYNDAKFVISTRYDFSILLSKFGNEKAVKIAQEHHYHNNNKKYINILSTKYKRIDFLCALTKTLEKDYKEFLKNNHHTKVILLPNMLTEVPKVKSTLKGKNILTVSRLDSGKKNDDIIKAFSKLKNKDWKLYIIGDGEEFDNLSKLIKKLNLDGRVILAGYRNKKEIEKYMLDSSLFLMASVSEGLPMVLLEAMSYGVPCIAYETASGTSDIIENGKNGYIIKDRNEEEYISKIEELINDEEKRKQYGNYAKKSIKRFTKEEIVKIWEIILK